MGNHRNGVFLACRTRLKPGVRNRTGNYSSSITLHAFLAAAESSLSAVNSVALSVSDAVSVFIMKKRSIDRICSFDSDFDKVEGIVRVHKPCGREYPFPGITGQKPFRIPEQGRIVKPAGSEPNHHAMPQHPAGCPIPGSR